MSVIRSITCAGAIVTALALSTTAHAQQDYRDWAEGYGSLYHHQDSGIVELVRLGTSSRPGLPQHAVVVSLDLDEVDSGRKNAILFECGMHAREWIAAESCFRLVDYLVENRDTDEVQDLLDRVDVWVIPQTNPAGRLIDDRSWGDPTNFHYTCRGGSDEGEACDNDSDCGGVGATCDTNGWRTNANTDSCDHGVDLARNWSTDWDNAPTCSTGDFMKYRGDDPFSEPETRNLRRFVHNHMITSVAIVHANTQGVDGTWNAPGPGGDHSAIEAIEAAVVAETTGSGLSPDPKLGRPTSIGNSVGQFSAWLRWPSDTVGEPDEGTVRGIPTMFFELPFPGSAYYGSDFQHASGDGSSSLHMSGEDVDSLIDRSVVPAFLELIRQARTPGCPKASNGSDISSACVSTDVALVGARIGGGSTGPGRLSINPTARTEYVRSGRHWATIAVQNHGTSNRTVDLKVTAEMKKPAGWDPVFTSTHTFVNLLPDDRGVLRTAVPLLAVDGHAEEYRLTISLDSDGDATRDLDNTKIYRFTVEPPLKLDLTLIPHEGFGGFTTTGTAPVFTVDVPRATLSGIDLSKLRPDLTLYAHRPDLGVRPLTWTAPLPVSTWKVGSDGSRTLTPTSGPVASIRLQELKTSAGSQMRVSLVLADARFAAHLKRSTAAVLEIRSDAVGLAWDAVAEHTAGYRPLSTAGRKLPDVKDDPHDE